MIDRLATTASRLDPVPLFVLERARQAFACVPKAEALGESPDSHMPH
jgi:hypothetical protein